MSIDAVASSMMRMLLFLTNALAKQKSCLCPTLKFSPPSVTTASDHIKHEKKQLFVFFSCWSINPALKLTFEGTKIISSVGEFSYLSTESSRQSFHHVLQLSDLECLPQAIVRARPLRIQIKSAIHVMGHVMCVGKKPKISFWLHGTKMYNNTHTYYALFFNALTPFPDVLVKWHFGQNTSVTQYKSIFFDHVIALLFIAAYFWGWSFSHFTPQHNVLLRWSSASSAPNCAQFCLCWCFSPLQPVSLLPTHPLS